MQTLSCDVSKVTLTARQIVVLSNLILEFGHPYFSIHKSKPVASECLSLALGLSIHTVLRKWSFEYLFQVPAALLWCANSVLRLIKSAGLGSCSRGYTTDNITCETQALRDFGMKHSACKSSAAVPEPTVTHLLFFSCWRKRAFLKSQKLNRCPWRSWRWKYFSCEQLHTHRKEAALVGLSRDQQPYLQVMGSRVALLLFCLEFCRWNMIWRLTLNSQAHGR